MPEIRVFTIFLQVCISLVFLDIGQDCSLGRCQTCSRAENLFIHHVIRCPVNFTCFDKKSNCFESC